MDDAQLKRRMEQQKLIQDRLQDRERIQLGFARYGGNVCRIIWEELRRHQGLHQVLQKLGLPRAASFDMELETIQRFISEQGPGAFVRRIHPNQNFLDWNVFGDTEEANAAAETVVGAKRASAPSCASPAVPPSDPSALSHAIGVAGAGAKHPDPHHAADHATPSHWFDPHGNYTGPERRASKNDRRKGADRRAGVESISKNKRFGGDRRKTHGRRKTDPR